MGPPMKSGPIPFRGGSIARAVVRAAVCVASFGETPADDVGGGDEAYDHPRSRRIEVVRDRGSNERCCDDSDHGPELRRQRSPLRFGTRTGQADSCALHALANRSVGYLSRRHQTPFSMLLMSANLHKTPSTKHARDPSSV